MSKNKYGSFELTDAEYLDLMMRFGQWFLSRSDFSVHDKKEANRFAREFKLFLEVAEDVKNAVVVDEKVVDSVKKEEFL